MSRKRPAEAVSNACAVFADRNTGLRIGETRVFYDISGSRVEILAIVTKSETEAWLRQFGDPA